MITNKELYKEYTKIFGYRAHIKFMEEMGELIEVLMEDDENDINIDHLAEEICDVTICKYLYLLHIEKGECITLLTSHINRFGATRVLCKANHQESQLEQTNTHNH